MEYCPIKEGAISSPHAIAVEYLGTGITYARFDRDIDAITTPKRLCLYEPPSYSLICSIFSAFRNGSTLFIANTKIPKGEIEKIDYGYFQGLILMTSGSTASPKLAQVSLENLYYNALGTLSAIDLKPQDRYLLSLPLYHVSGMGILWRTFLRKSTLVLPDPNSDLTTLLSRRNITHASLVPTQLSRLLSNHPPDFPCLKCLLLGGAPIQPTLYQKGCDNNLPIFLTYGLTETASAIVISKNPILKDSLLYLGHPLPYRELKVEGEIFVKGEVLFQGYYGEPKPSGWLATRDLGLYDSKLGLAICGRKDRMFISGGENIQPEEIERVLLLHPAVLEAYVTSEKNIEFGSVPIAYVKYDYLCDLKGFLKNHLPKYKIPKKIKIMPQDLVNKKLA